MNKVVYNACYGGFSLSEKAVILAREISGDVYWGEIPLKGERYSDGEPCRQFYGHLDYGFPRHDKTLVQVIEQIGAEANGMCAKLRVATISGNLYRIDEYDGFESVIEPDDQEWIMINEIT